MTSSEKTMNINSISTTLFHSIINHIKNVYPTLHIQYSDLNEVSVKNSIKLTL